MAGLEDVLLQGWRTLFLVGVPVLVAVTLAGVIVGAVQASMAIEDPAPGYAVRLLALLVVLYLMGAGFVQGVLALARLAFA